jgi:cytochrome c
LLSLLAGRSVSAGEPPPIEALLADADADSGALIFNQCTACHSAKSEEPNRIGPNLWGVVGRPVASAVNFAYSPALRGLEGEWNVVALNRYLYDPATYAPGTKMAFPGIKDDQQRANVIAHLHRLSETPLALARRTNRKGGESSADPFGSDWPQAPGRELTGRTCNACHSLAIVKQQGLSRTDWDEVLDWMVEEQGMVELDAQQRDQVLAYLALNFGVDRRNR